MVISAPQVGQKRAVALTGCPFGQVGAAAMARILVAPAGHPQGPGRLPDVRSGTRRAGERRGRLDPAATTARDVPLLLLTLAAAATSIAAFLLHVAGWVRMPYGAAFISLPGMVLLLAIGVHAGRTSRGLLFNRLVVGAAAGLIGLLAYDGVRLLAQLVLPFEFNGFRTMELFGTYMTGLPGTHPGAVAAGWGYHITNGLTFAIAYAVVAGPARWWWGLAWGTVLEVAMLVVYPAIFQIETVAGFVTISVVGHVAYGAALGIWCERHAMGWRR